MVSMRVVKTVIVSSWPSISSVKLTPSDLPIQCSCILRTRSGQCASSLISSRSVSAYFVMAKNHCSSLLLTTTASQRSHLPSTTCSLASTVAQSGHQLTSPGAR